MGSFPLHSSIGCPKAHRSLHSSSVTYPSITLLDSLLETIIFFTSSAAPNSYSYPLSTFFIYLGFLLRRSWGLSQRLFSILFSFVFFFVKIVISFTYSAHEHNTPTPISTHYYVPLLLEQPCIADILSLALSYFPALSGLIYVFFIKCMYHVDTTTRLSRSAPVANSRGLVLF